MPHNLWAYDLVTVPKNKHKKGTRVALSKAIYNPANMSVTLVTRAPLVLSTPIQLTLMADDLLDTSGQPLDGNDSGMPGANYVALLTKGGISVTSAVPAVG